ncbi:hypothetical protein U1Q18_027829 [Sarracenia purpurea var. burkii]
MHVQIYQWPSGFTSLNIPKYTVQIVNEAWGAAVGVFDVHISCGDFASTCLVNPMIFRRIGLDNCLVKNGKKIDPGEMISFDYANILPYPFSVAQVRC